MDQKNKTEIGPIIGTVIIIILIVIGSLYFWGKRMQTEQENAQAIQSAGMTTEMAASAEATNIETVSPDDSLSTINAENKATNTSNLSAQ